MNGVQRHQPHLRKAGRAGVPNREPAGLGCFGAAGGSRKIWPDRARLGIKGHLLPRSHLAKIC